MLFCIVIIVWIHYYNTLSTHIRLINTHSILFRTQSSVFTQKEFQYNKIIHSIFQKKRSMVCVFFSFLLFRFFKSKKAILLSEYIFFICCMKSFLCMFCYRTKGIFWMWMEIIVNFGNTQLDKWNRGVMDTGSWKTCLEEWQRQKNLWKNL